MVPTNYLQTSTQAQFCPASPSPSSSSFLASPTASIFSSLNCSFSSSITTTSSLSPALTPSPKPSLLPSSQPQPPAYVIRGTFEPSTPISTHPKAVTGLPASSSLVTGVSHLPLQLCSSRFSRDESAIWGPSRLGRTQFFKSRPTGAREDWNKQARFRPMGSLGPSEWMSERNNIEMMKVSRGGKGVKRPVLGDDDVMGRSGAVRCARCEGKDMTCSLVEKGRDGEERCVRCVRKGDGCSCVKMGYTDTTKQGMFEKKAGGKFQAAGLSLQEAEDLAAELLGCDAVSTGGIGFDAPKVSRREAKSKALPNWWRIPTHSQVRQVEENLNPGEVDQMMAVAHWDEYRTFIQTGKSELDSALLDREKQFADMYKSQDFFSPERQEKCTISSGVVPGMYLMSETQREEANWAAHLDRMHVLSNILERETDRE